MWKVYCLDGVLLARIFFGKISLAGIFSWELSPPLPGFLIVCPLNECQTYRSKESGQIQARPFLKFDPLSWKVTKAMQFDKILTEEVRKKTTVSVCFIKN